MVPVVENVKEWNEAELWNSNRKRKLITWASHNRKDELIPLLIWSISWQMDPLEPTPNDETDERNSRLYKRSMTAEMPSIEMNKMDSRRHSVDEPHLRKMRKTIDVKKLDFVLEGLTHGMDIFASFTIFGSQANKSTTWKNFKPQNKDYSNKLLDSLNENTTKGDSVCFCF